MATNTIVTCDLCKEEIKPGARIVRFSAMRYTDPKVERPGWIPGAYVPEFRFEMSEFCSDACVINAVRGLLNGNA